MLDELPAQLGASLFVALSKAKQSGWHVMRGDLRSLARWLRQAVERTDSPLPYAHIVRTRQTDNDVQVLRPINTEQAAARSLSAQFGRGTFPFHTDGAHLEVPPDFVLLAVERPGACDVPTHLLRFPVPHPSPLLSEDLRLGVFRVDSGVSGGFYNVCQFSDGSSMNCVRFDPGCMRPVDPRSRRLADAISSSTPDYSHSWRNPGEILIIDNHHVLHSRGDASKAPDRALCRLLLRDTGVLSMARA